MKNDQGFNTALVLLTIIEAILKIAQMRLNSGAFINDHKSPQCDAVHWTKFGTLALNIMIGRPAPTFVGAGILCGMS